MKNFKKGLLFLGLVMSLSSSLVFAATFDADYGTVDGSSSTEYNVGGPVIYGGGTYTSYTTTFVGLPDSDELLASQDLGNSSDAGEIAFIKEVTGEDLTGAYTQVVPGSSVSINTGTGLSTLNLASDFDGGYFMLKFGGNTNDSHWIFKNNNSLNALIWLSEISFKANSGENGGSILGLSHYATTSCVGEDCGLTPGDGTEVPIPAAIWLFGSALFGLMGVSRKQKTMVA